jgi:succinoglycan biosynthesis protein ExoV
MATAGIPRSTRLKLHVCRVPGGNFGDDLNDILWPELFPDILESDNPSIVYGIGSILGGDVPADTPKVILGSGLGYRKSKPLGPDWTIRWVRGKLTAKALEIDESFALGDSALLWSKLYQQHSTGAKIGFMPHHATWESYDWSRIADQAGLFAINPKASPETILQQMIGCRSVITESLHGAIFADCLRIPWQSLALSYRFNRFKWRDWLSISGLEFSYSAAPYPLTEKIRPSNGLKNRIVKVLASDNDLRLNSLRPTHTARTAECDAVIDFLGQLTLTDGLLNLSKSQTLDSIRNRMAEAARRFAQDYGLRCTL